MVRTAAPRPGDARSLPWTSWTSLPCGPVTNRPSRTSCGTLWQTSPAGPPRSIFAARLTARRGGAKIYLKREDLLHTGATRSTTRSDRRCWRADGQAADHRRDRRRPARRGHGDGGALFGLECVVYMGEVDMARQALNVFRMRLLGAEVRRVTSGSRTLKDAINEAMRDWVTTCRTRTSSRLGRRPHPIRGWCATSSGHRRRGPRAVPRPAGRLPD